MIPDFPEIVRPAAGNVNVRRLSEELKIVQHALKDTMTTLIVNLAIATPMEHSKFSEQCEHTIY